MHLQMLLRNFHVFQLKVDWQVSSTEKEQLQREFVEIHKKLGDATIPFEIRGKSERRRDQIIKQYQTKFGKHISADI